MRARKPWVLSRFRTFGCQVRLVDIGIFLLYFRHQVHFQNPETTDEQFSKRYYTSAISDMSNSTWRNGVKLLDVVRPAQRLGTRFKAWYYPKVSLVARRGGLWDRSPI